MTRRFGPLAFVLAWVWLTLAAPPAQAFYNPHSGRFLTRDPQGERGGVNLYAFVGNDPVNAVDPLGLEVAIESSFQDGDPIRVVYYEEYWLLGWRRTGQSTTLYAGQYRQNLGSEYIQLSDTLYLNVSAVRYWAEEQEHDQVGREDLDRAMEANVRYFLPHDPLGSEHVLSHLSRLQHQSWLSDWDRRWWRQHEPDVRHAIRLVHGDERRRYWSQLWIDVGEAVDRPRSRGSARRHGSSRLGNGPTATTAEEDLARLAGWQHRMTAAAAEGLSNLTLLAAAELTPGEGVVGPSRAHPVDLSTSGRTAEEAAKIREYARRANRWLDQHGPQTIQSTQGTLRREASAAARAERLRAASAGKPYIGQAGHVPDTAVTGQANPLAGWLDMPGTTNQSAGGTLGNRIGQLIDHFTVDGVTP